MAVMSLSDIIDIENRYPEIFRRSILKRFLPLIIFAGVVLYVLYCWWFFSIGAVISGGQWERAGITARQWYSYEIRPTIRFSNGETKIQYPRFSVLGDNPDPDWVVSDGGNVRVAFGSARFVEANPEMVTVTYGDETLQIRLETDGAKPVSPLPDWATQREIFHPDSRQARTWIDGQGRPAMLVMGREEYQANVTPFFDITWKYRRDKNLDGNPLQVGGKTYTRGLSIHSKTLLRYSIGSEYRRFQTVMGIDDELARRGLGDVHVVISGDGKPLWEGDVKGTDEPRPLDLDVTGVRDLEILVDFGGDLVHDLLAEGRSHDLEPDRQT